jgi:lipid A 4'-phosphatase
VSYLKAKRGQWILASFLTATLLLIMFPGIDIAVSGLFYHDGFHIKGQWWQNLLHAAVAFLLCASIAAAAGIYLFNRFTKRSICALDDRKFCYLVIVLLLGPGLIVNVVFKDGFGRARPRDIQEFGGAKLYTPPFVVSQQCDTNCSFSSGEGAGAFFTLALAPALSRRRSVLVAAVAFGVVVSVSRIAAGAHFFSDTVVSFFVMLIVADVLYHYMVLTRSERYERLKVAPAAAVLQHSTP